MLGSRRGKLPGEEDGIDVHSEDDDEAANQKMKKKNKKCNKKRKGKQ